MTIDVRIASDDAAFAEFRELVVEYDESLDADLRHADLKSHLADIPGAYYAPSAAFVARADGVPAGCVGFQVLDERTIVVKKLYVRPCARGLGVARALLGALLDTARQRGFRRAVLDTERRRLNAAYNLYVSFGFTECPPYGDVDYRCPTYMELEL